MPYLEPGTLIILYIFRRFYLGLNGTSNLLKKNINFGLVVLNLSFLICIEKSLLAFGARYKRRKEI